MLQRMIRQQVHLLPKLQPTEVLTEYQPYINGGGGRLEKANYKGKTFANGSVKRSKFFQGVAEAMAKQWSEFVLKGAVADFNKNFEPKTLFENEM